MITVRELKYAATGTNNVPYPGIYYATKALKKLKEAIECFDTYYNGKQYDIVLSNGEQILFEILSKNLCHLVGIDYKNLTSSYFDYYRENVLGSYDIPKAYDLLKQIIDNFDEVLRYDHDNNYRAINYYRVMVKCSIFEKLSNFSKFNFGVINFDKDTYENNSNLIISCRSNKFLYVQSNEPSSPYFLMGILLGSDLSRNLNNQHDKNSQDKYVPETLIAPTNTKDFFNNQEVVIPTQILVTTDERMEKIEASPDEKIALLNQYRAILKEHDIPNRINIYGDYESMLAEQASVKTRIKDK